MHCRADASTRILPLQLWAYDKIQNTKQNAVPVFRGFGPLIGQFFTRGPYKKNKYPIIT
jgi:hypothetical protein